MEEPHREFPFRKLRYYTYLTLDVMMHVEYQEANKFMYALNMESRSFFEKNFITVRNGFINEGLITYDLRCDFNDYVQLERLYFQALKRTIVNRLLTIQVIIKDSHELTILNEVLRFIQAKQQYIRLQLKLKVDWRNDQFSEEKKNDHEQLSEFLNSHRIIELDIKNLSKKLSLNDTLSQSVRHLKVDNDEFIDLKLFKSLQILDIAVRIDQNMLKVIFYLASKFTQDHFKRMQINLHLNLIGLEVRDINLNHLPIFLPKRIEINAKYIDIDSTIGIFDFFDPSIASFNKIRVGLTHQNFEELEVFSYKVREFRILDYIQEQFKDHHKEYKTNYNSITDHLSIQSIRNQITIVQTLNFFKNIKTLGIDWNPDFQCQIPEQKINFPQLQSLRVQNCLQLRFFSGLKSLKHLSIDVWDEQINIDDIFEPSHILELETYEIKNSQEILSLFTNLRSLQLGLNRHQNIFCDYFSQIKALKTLTLYDIESLDQLSTIFNDCRQLHTLTIHQGKNVMKFVENLFDQIKQNHQGSSSINVIFEFCELSIKEAVTIMKMLQNESTVSQILKISFKGIQIDNKQFKEIIPDINKEEHPIMHSFISTIINQFNDDD